MSKTLPHYSSPTERDHNYSVGDYNSQESHEVMRTPEPLESEVVYGSSSLREGENANALSVEKTLQENIRNTQQRIRQAQAQREEDAGEHSSEGSNSVLEEVRSRVQSFRIRLHNADGPENDQRILKGGARSARVVTEERVADAVVAEGFAEEGETEAYEQQLVREAMRANIKGAINKKFYEMVYRAPISPGGGRGRTAKAKAVVPKAKTPPVRHTQASKMATQNKHTRNSTPKKSKSPREGAAIKAGAGNIRRNPRSMAYSYGGSGKTVIQGGQYPLHAIYNGTGLVHEVEEEEDDELGYGNPLESQQDREAVVTLGRNSEGVAETLNLQISLPQASLASQNYNGLEDLKQQEGVETSGEREIVQDKLNQDLHEDPIEALAQKRIKSISKGGKHARKNSSSHQKLVRGLTGGISNGVYPYADLKETRNEGSHFPGGALNQSVQYHTKAMSMLSEGGGAGNGTHLDTSFGSANNRQIEDAKELTRLHKTTSKATKRKSI